MTRAQKVLGRLGEALDGKRHLKVLHPADAEDVCNHIHAEVDRHTDERERAAAADGHTVACHEGCAVCCHAMPTVLAGEAMTIARWLGRPEQAITRARFLEKYPAWIARAGDLVEAYRAAFLAGDVDAAREVTGGTVRRRVMCAFNHEGSCTIYPVRPTICRTAHALDRVCDPEVTDEVTSYRHEPLEAYVEGMSRVGWAMHALLRGAVAPEPLCSTVHAALTDPDGYLSSK